MKALDFIIYRARYAASVTCLSLLLLLTTLFWISGTFDPDVLPEFYSSQEQLLGTIILLILNPAFLVLYLIIGQRRSLRFAQNLFDDGVCKQTPEAWLRSIDAKVPLLGAGLGLFYGLVVNSPAQWVTDFAGTDAPTRSIVIGQAFLWSVAGLTLSYRLHTAYAFFKLGRSAEPDLLEPRKIEPFAKSGVDDVLAIALVLVLSTIQGLDAHFRFANYAAAMLIALPAATLLFILPMITIHRRLVQTRANYLSELSRVIADMSRQKALEPTQSLELILQHRDRIAETSTWPIDWKIYSRLALYIVLPPIAWVAAAFVEVGVDRFLGS